MGRLYDCFVLDSQKQDLEAIGGDRSHLNARPLTYVQDDLDGATDTLSPSHLIYG